MPTRSSASSSASPARARSLGGRLAPAVDALRRQSLSTNIITIEGHAALKKELDHLWRVYRPEITQKVFFGAWVDIENDDGEQLRFRIVGYDEIHGRNDYISIDSPMARALLKKAEGDEVVVRTPTGEATCRGARLYPSRSTANGLALSARRVPTTPAPPTSTAPASGSANSHGCGAQCRSKA
ncbi:hypothetical protein WR25_02717 [Diploscapter pachys]|uniref:Transcription elongation factor GreA/GreB C-terminal domain-containing protein n=1 Tax=Diploscapter pachys TaxID=2018661 RepID=A0A2A2K651_9BILA|nr:hypothetical protein WR25_02717 [Diploscapter pachys]